MSKMVKVSRVFVWCYEVDASSYKDWDNDVELGRQMTDEQIIEHEMNMDTNTLLDLFIGHEGPFDEYAKIEISDTE